MTYLFNTDAYQALNKAHAEKILPLINQAESESEQFNLTRRLGIGGSDMGKLMKISPWSTPFKLWQEKTLRDEERDTADNVFTHWGTILEQPIKKEYWDLVGHTYGDEIKANISFPHPELGCIHANFDGLIYKDGVPVRVVEIKTAMQNSNSGEFNSVGQSILSWGDGNLYQTNGDEIVGIAQEDNQIPASYYLQVQLYMSVAGVDVADLAVLIGHHDFRIFTIHADKELQNTLLETADQFWCKNVLEDLPPELTAQDLDVKQSIPGSVVADKDALNNYFNLLRVKEQIKQLTAEKDQYEDALKESIGLNDMLINSQGAPLCTYKTSAARKTLNTDLLKKNEPEIYAKYLKESVPTRRFLVKALKAI